MWGHITAVFMIIAGAVAIPATSYQSRVDGYRHGHYLGHGHINSFNHGYDHKIHHDYAYGLSHAYSPDIGHGLGNYGHGHHEHAWAYPAYKFSYSVHDPHTGDYKSQSEYRDGDLVKGSYSVAEAGGNIRNVHYSADDHHGFNAAVHHHTVHHQVHGHHYPYHH